MGQKFQYDESGSTFFYFLLSFLALILVPTTVYFWPREKKRDPEEENKQCRCPPCIKKREFQRNADPWKRSKNLIIKLVLGVGWIAFFLLAYKVSQFDYELANFDPYEILGIPLGASQGEIKKAYRRLSLILHPDKDTGNEKEFMKLSKAYQALTDDEARKNWEKYGNPDGPGAMSFGIALPSWIVEKENSVWVLGLYGLVFMVALPIVVSFHTKNRLKVIELKLSKYLSHVINLSQSDIEFSYADSGWLT
jgi:translocation protein SEC63